MSGTNLSLNVIPFSHPVEKLDFFFHKEKQQGYCPIKQSEFPANIKDLINEEELKKTLFLYTNFQPDSNAPLKLNVDLTQAKDFARHYYKDLVFQYFKPLARLVRYNYVWDIEVWFKHEEQPSNLYDLYNKITLRVQHSRITPTHELLVYYSGKTAISTRSIKDLKDISPSLYHNVMYQGRLYKYVNLPEEAMYHLDEAYPHINHDLRDAFGISIPKPNPKENRYLNINRIIQDFYTDHLNTDTFKAMIPLCDKGFHALKEEKIFRTTRSSNFLQFGQGAKGINPKKDLPQKGPYQLPQSKTIHFFYIIQETEREKGLEFREYLLGNKQGFSGLQEYIKVPFHLEKDFSIRFKNATDPLPETEEQLRNKPWNTDITYFALYLSPISKTETDTEKHKVYYRIKELLLKYGISSQVIDRSKVGMKGYHFSLANIAIAILAKLNGIPWRLDSEIKNELVIGVGAFKNKEIGVRYIGSTFCFSNNGNFHEFSCYSATESYLLAGQIEKAIKTFLENNEKIERLIIHYYKTMNKKEQKDITEMLFNLGLSIPVFIVSVYKTESEDYFLYDTNFDQLMPHSGTIVNIGNNQYLLCNNTRYHGLYESTIESYHLPVKLYLSSTHPELLKKEVVQELIDQVYQFSRMYWKSLKQQSLPVTITYPEMVAEMFPYFEQSEIPAFGQKNLWFL